MRVEFQAFRVYVYGLAISRLTSLVVVMADPALPSGQIFAAVYDEKE